MAKIGLTAVIFLCFNWAIGLAQDIAVVPDSSATASNPAIQSYHQAWTFEEGFEEEYLSQKAYHYEEVQREKNWFEQVKQRLANAWDRFWAALWDAPVVSGFWHIFSQLAPYFLILVLMALLVWLAMKYNSGGSEHRKIGFAKLSPEEILLKSNNLSALAAEAIQNQDFRLALRYRYLLVLQQLIKRKLIVWKSSKTNYDYQKELRETPFQGPFSEVTRVYNFVWYGHFDLDAKTFEDLEPAFNQFEKQP